MRHRSLQSHRASSTRTGSIPAAVGAQGAAQGACRMRGGHEPLPLFQAAEAFFSRRHRHGSRPYRPCRRHLPPTRPTGISSGGMPVAPARGPCQASFIPLDLPPPSFRVRERGHRFFTGASGCPAKGWRRRRAGMVSRPGPLPVAMPAPGASPLSTGPPIAGRPAACRNPRRRGAGGLGRGRARRRSGPGGGKSHQTETA